MGTAEPQADVAIVGAGAAGMVAAIFVKRRQPAWRVVALDAAAVLGRKVLASGGGRCNLTHRSVDAQDYRGGRTTTVRRVLQAFDATAARSFFSELGVPTRCEPDGRVFPASNHARTLLRSLLHELDRLGVIRATAQRVAQIESRSGGFVLTTPARQWHASRVLLATGGLAMPSSGCDGSGYTLAEGLGHTIVPPTPALVPLLCRSGPFGAGAGVTLPAELTLRARGDRPVRCVGALLFTHTGISGPAALDISRFWTRAHLEGREPQLTANLLPAFDHSSLGVRLDREVRERPRLQIATLLQTWLPGSLVHQILEDLGVAPEQRLAHLSRARRRALLHRTLEWRLPITGAAGYERAEATAGGVALDEVQASSLESRRCPGAFFAGELLDVDGRLGGFNFQWAWASAWVAAQGLGRKG